MADISTSYETERVKSGGRPFTPATSQTNLALFITILLMSMGTVAAVVTITVMNPGQDNAATITPIITIVSPLLIGLLAYMQRTSHVEQNSKLTEMTVRVGDAAFAAGQLIEKEKQTNAGQIADATAEARARLAALTAEAAALEAVIRRTHEEAARLAALPVPAPQITDLPPGAVIGEVRGQVTGEVVLKPGPPEKPHDTKSDP